MQTNQVKILLFFSVMMFASFSTAAVEFISGKILGTLTDSQNYGFCMLRVDYQPTIDCQPYWVSVDCAGDYHGKETSRRLWDSAQLGVALDARVKILVNDSKKYNGYCVADRLDIYK